MYGTYGIKFNDKTSNEMGLLVQITSRPILPEKRRNELEIPGRDGVIDFGGNTFANRLITMDISIKETTREAFNAKAREIANWLAEKGTLCLLEEPDIYYVGQVFSLVDLKKLLFNLGTISVTFEVEPYAYKLTYPDTTVINSITDLTNADYTKIL